MPLNIDDTFYTRDPAVSIDRLTAGGVVVRVESGRIRTALIREDDLPGYVLPKGGVDEGEAIEEAALREIEEEAGLSRLTKLSALAVLERHDSKKKYWSIIHYGLYLTDEVEGRIRDTDHHYGMAWYDLNDLPEMFWPDEKKLIAENRRHIEEQVIMHQNPGFNVYSETDDMSR